MNICTGMCLEEKRKVGTHDATDGRGFAQNMRCVHYLSMCACMPLSLGLSPRFRLSNRPVALSCTVNYDYAQVCTGVCKHVCGHLCTHVCLQLQRAGRLEGNQLLYARWLEHLNRNDWMTGIMPL